MKQEGIPIREFARRDGCSEALVRKRLKTGHLQAFPDGSLDPALVGSEWRKSNWPGRKGAHQKCAPAANPANRSHASSHHTDWTFLAAIEDPAQRAAVKGAMKMAYQGPGIASAVMIDAGIPVATVKDLFPQMVASFMEMAGMVLADCEPFASCPEGEAPVWDVGAFETIIWGEMADEKIARQGNGAVDPRHGGV